MLDSHSYAVFLPPSPSPKCPFTPVCSYDSSPETSGPSDAEHYEDDSDDNPEEIGPYLTRGAEGMDGEVRGDPLKVIGVCRRARIRR